MKGKERAKSSIDKDVESGCSLELWFFLSFWGDTIWLRYAYAGRLGQYRGDPSSRGIYNGSAV